MNHWNTREPRFLSASLATLLVVTGTACVGIIGGESDRAGAGSGKDGNGANGSAIDGTTPPSTLGQSPLRRLNRTEYDNSVRDLFGVGDSPSSAWPSDASDSGFDNDVSGQGPTAPLVEQMARSAERVATEAVANLGALLPCATQNGDDPTSCAASFVEQYGRRVYRRPLTDSDRSRLMAVFDWGNKRDGLTAGIRLVIATMLQSPYFLYRPEVGVPAAPGATQIGVALTDHEIATRLSYLVVNSCPDVDLLDAADNGAVHTPEQIKAQAERLLSTRAGRDSVKNFFRQWLPFAQLATAAKDPELFPDFDDDTRAALTDGMHAFLEHVVFDSEKGDVNELMTANYAFVDAKTAPLYGITGFTGTGLQKATAPSARAGMLTQAGLLTALAKNRGTAPIARGKFVYKELFCGGISPPPANLPNAGVPPTEDPDKTTRELYAEHRSNPACAGCHALLDPPGFALEHYDAVGRYRDTENGKPVDATADMTVAGQVVSINGAVELAKFAVTNPEFQGCVAKKWFTYTFGRRSGADDQPTADQLTKLLADGSKIRDFMIAVTQTYAFSHLLPRDPQDCAQ